MVMSKIRDSSLAKLGDAELGWARQNMPILARIRKEFEKDKPLKGVRIGVALHLEKKTGVLLETLAAGGAEIAACSCNPLTTDDKVAAALAGKMKVFAWAGQTNKEYYSCIESVLDTKPQIVIDDGCDLIFALHTKRRELLRHVNGGCEETTTGIHRLKAMHNEGKLTFPVFAVNDAYSKYLFDNRFGTAQSVVDAVSRATNKLIAGKTVVVVGFGWCGRGIADRMKGLGANIIVVETATDYAGKGATGYHKALEALYSGYRVMGMERAASEGDIFITATGNKNVMAKEHFGKMKDCALLANAGHFNVEIDEPALRKMSKSVREVKENLVQYVMRDGRRLNLLSEGRLVNLARPSGQGHPIEIMDGSFGIQALCVRHIAEHATKKGLAPGVHEVPREIDIRVAAICLESQGVKLKEMTKEQLGYIRSWGEGT